MTAQTPDKARGQGKARCPVCGKPPIERYAPFCSRRCADIDLGRWLKGTYAIPASEPTEADVDEDDPNAEAGERGPPRPRGR